MSRNMRGEWTSYTYDSDGRLSIVEFFDDETITYDYDEETNQRMLMEDTRLALGNGTYSWDYDDEQRLVREIAPEGAVTSTTYDPLGRRRSLIDPDGNVTSYVYDSYGRLAYLYNGFGQGTTLSYDSLGRLTRVDYANGTYTTRGYDDYGRMVDLINWLEDDSVGQRFRYAFDPNGNVARTTFAYVPQTDELMYVAYAYDALDRLTVEEWRAIMDYSIPEISNDYRMWQRNYVYDAVGNRTAMGWFNGSTTTTTTYSYNNLNQLTLVTDQWEFTYDNNGNMTAKEGPSELWTYDWSEDNRLVGVLHNTGSLARTTFAYDALGRRLVRQDEDGTWTRYFYDGLNVLLEREATTDPSTWGDDFVGEDAQDGNTSEWGTWSATPTTFSNLWDAPRRSRVIQTSDTGTATRAIVGDSSFINQANDNPWNADVPFLNVAMRRIESGTMRFDVHMPMSAGTARGAASPV